MAIRRRNLPPATRSCRPNSAATLTLILCVVSVTLQLSFHDSFREYVPVSVQTEDTTTGRDLLGLGLPPIHEEQLDQVASSHAASLENKTVTLLHNTIGMSLTQTEIDRICSEKGKEACRHLQDFNQAHSPVRNNNQAHSLVRNYNRAHSVVRNRIESESKGKQGKDAANVVANTKSDDSANSVRGAIPVSAFLPASTPTSNLYPNPNRGLCFVTSVFGSSVEMADKPPDVENVFPNDDRSEYDFFLFTNLEKLTSPGWTNIVMTDLPYRRFITQSRWGKFVGWRHKALAHCGTVIYTDAYITPQVDVGLAPFRRIAAQVSNSRSGLAQDLHDQFNGTPMRMILRMIAVYKKDVRANTKASLRWLQKQPDFAEQMPYYINKWFGKFSFDHIDRTLQQRRSILIYAILSFLPVSFYSL
jgi:hypothetical protein